MMIMMVVLILEDQLQALVYLLVNLSTHGEPRNKVVYPDRPLRVNIVLWSLYKLCVLEVHYYIPLILYYDNRISLHIVVNHVLYEKTKHLEINCHLVKEISS